MEKTLILDTHPPPLTEKDGGGRIAIKMRRFNIINLLSISFLAILTLPGCLPIDKSIEFENRDYNMVFDKTIQFIALKGWKITLRDRDAGVIQFVYKERYSPGVVQKGPDNIFKRNIVAMPPRKVEYNISITLLKRGANTIVRLKTTDVFVWDPEKTIKEYREFIEK